MTDHAELIDRLHRENADLRVENEAMRSRVTILNHAVKTAGEILAKMGTPSVAGAAHEFMVPQIQWVKDHPGQITNGRIGRPVVRLGSISWLPKALGDAVRAALGHTQGGE